jgi:hypothetical protein
MAGTGRLELNFVDVNGLPIHDTIDIRLRHHVLHEESRIDGHSAARELAVEGLRTEPQGLYVLEIRGRAYWPVQRFVTIAANGLTRQTITLPIRPDRARAIFPAYDELDDRVKGVLERSSKVKGHEGLTGRALYSMLSDEAKAGLLNIARKSLATQFRDGADILAHTTLLDIRGDRCFVDVPRSLKDQMPEFVQRELFRPVDGGLHKAPEGFQPSGSFKTSDAFGNLQMTFFESGDRCVADVDIDDAAGLGHVFQVMRNHLTGNPTHPYNIHQILVTHQHLDPGYRLVPRVA